MRVRWKVIFLGLAAASGVLLLWAVVAPTVRLSRAIKKANSFCITGTFLGEKGSIQKISARIDRPADVDAVKEILLRGSLVRRTEDMSKVGFTTPFSVSIDFDCAGRRELLILAYSTVIWGNRYESVFDMNLGEEIRRVLLRAPNLDSQQITQPSRP